MGIVGVGCDVEDEEAWVVDGCEIFIGGDGDVGDKDDVDVEDEQTWVVDGDNFRSVVVDPFGNF